MDEQTETVWVCPKCGCENLILRAEALVVSNGLFAPAVILCGGCEARFYPQMDVVGGSG